MFFNVAADMDFFGFCRILWFLWRFVMWAPLLTCLPISCQIHFRAMLRWPLHITAPNCVASDFGDRCHLAEQFLEMEIDTDMGCLATNLSRLTSACHFKSIVRLSCSDYPDLDLSGFFP